MLSTIKDVIQNQSVKPNSPAYGGLGFVMYSDDYRFVNRILVFVIAAFACIISVLYFSGTGGCPSRTLFGEPCILCGCTRDFFGVFKGELGLRNPLSPWLFCFILAEFAWRFVFSFARAGKTVVRTDAILHLAAAIPLLAYLVAINPLWR